MGDQWSMLSVNFERFLGDFLGDFCEFVCKTQRPDFYKQINNK